MSDLKLSFASGPYDRMQALRDGVVKPSGIELTYITLQPAEIFWRMLQYREFEVSEMSMSNYLMAASRNDCPFVGLPVFPSRVFRHGYIFINTEKGIRKPTDLIGRVGGVPEYSQTAAVHARAILQHEYGVRPDQIEWVQGREDRVGGFLPKNIRLRQTDPSRSLSEMLEAGEIDFLVTGNNPLCFRRKSPKVARLFPSYRDLELDYYKRTGIYPIMHMVVIRKDVLNAHPWIALNLYMAFCQSKELCYEQLLETGSPKASFAWLQPLIEEEQSVFGQDWYPYGIAANKRSIEAAIQFGYEQGLCPRMPAINELFAENCLREVPLGEGQMI